MGITPLLERSVFVNHGPITRPRLVLYTNLKVAFVNATTVNLVFGSVGPDALGRYLSLTGSVRNDGDYVITAVVTPTQLKLKASFSLPDGGADPAGEVFDPRHGQIADDPEHVTVRVNGIDVVPQAVVGLLGQIVLPVTPSASDDVKVDYTWIRNPTVGIQRLNSQEFRCNAWNRNIRGLTGRVYRYNNVLIKPSSVVSSPAIQSGSGASVLFPDIVLLPFANVLSSFVGLTVQLGGLNTGSFFRITAVIAADTVTVEPNPVIDTGASWQITDDQGSKLAPLAQPLQRDLKYRAYERAYTSLLNDPTRLLLNVPSKKIAYPPLQRTLDQTFVVYTPVVLPEIDPLAPWVRKGTGTANITFDRLEVEDNTSSNPLFWVRSLDLSFSHVFASTWQFEATVPVTSEGVWSGIASGYSDPTKACIVGYLNDGGVLKIGVLKQTYGNDPSTLSAWTGGIDVLGTSTGASAELDWSLLHNYRLYRSPDGVVSIYVDGEVVPLLRVVPDDLPYLEELNAPFDEIQGSFFGALSRPALVSSTWDFVRYLILPTNPVQTAPSVFVSYEGNIFPEVAPPPWTPIGYHGVETLIGDTLWLSSTSAAVDTGGDYVGGDFRAYSRIEPLLQAASDTVLDVGFQGRTFTHGITPNALTAILDDSRRLCQLSFLSDVAAPKLGYGGRVLPTGWQPTPWSELGTASAEMRGRILLITDTSVVDGKVYYLDDTAANPGPDRVLGNNDYFVEFRNQINSYTVDVAGFAGATVEIYDSSRVVGFMFREVLGIRYLTFHSEGIPLPGGDVPFEWLDGLPHVYRLTKNTVGDLITLLVDGVFVTSILYSSFGLPTPGPGFDPLIGTITFGSSTTASMSAQSVVQWHYVNTWRLVAPQKYVGLWKGSDPTELLGYHLPVKTTGVAASVAGNALGDTTDFVAAGVVAGDYLVIDSGTNRGVYEIAAVLVSSVTILGAFPAGPSVVAYRIPRPVDWTVAHRYRLVRDSSGTVALLLDVDVNPLLRVGYDELPSSTAGVARKVVGYLPSILWGALDPTNLSQASWDFVRYGMTRSPTELRLVPPHNTLNQRNVIASPEHIFTTIPHDHTDFWSSSTGQPPQTYPDFLRDEPNLVAYTLLNEGTPLVPQTQDQSTRGLIIVDEFVAGLNRPEDVLNSDGDFRLNNATKRTTVQVPEGVLYASLQVYEKTTGVTDVITPFCDNDGPDLGTFNYQKEVCLTYTGDLLPEDDVAAPTPWSLQSDTPSQVSRTVFGGILTYGTTGVTRSAYRNFTPLPDAPSLITQIRFRVKVLQDVSFGLGDSQVRLGFGSTPGITLSLAFLTQPTGDRYVVVFDQNTQQVLSGIKFDWFDGNYHTYRLVKDPGQQQVFVYVDS